MYAKEITIKIKVRDETFLNELIDEIDKSVYYVLYYSLELSSKDVNYIIEVKSKRRKFVNYQ